MRVLLALLLGLVLPAHADSDPGPLPDPEDWEALQVCLREANFGEEAQCVGLISTPCLRAADWAEGAHCYVFEREAWEAEIVFDLEPFLDQLAATWEVRQQADVNGLTGVVEAVAEERALWPDYLGAACRLAEHSGEARGMADEAQARCLMEQTAGRALRLIDMIHAIGPD